MSEITSEKSANTAVSEADAYSSNSQSAIPVTSVDRVEADGIQIFYRAAGDAASR
jgi:hypothetical protein